MKLYAARDDDEGNPSQSQRHDATVLHITNEPAGVWILMRNYERSGIADDGSGFDVWNATKDPSKPVKLGSFVPLTFYRGIAWIPVEDDNLRRHGLKAEPIEPYDGHMDGTLKEFLDNNIGSLTSEIAKRIVMLASAEYLADSQEYSFADWLSATDIHAGQARRVVEVVKRRDTLFKELQELVEHRRMVFVLAGRHSYLEEFLEGFEKYIDDSATAKKTAHVTVRYHPICFEEYSREYKTPGKSAGRFCFLDALLASMAYSAAAAIHNSRDKFWPGFFEADMVQNPVLFAHMYLRRSSNHNEHWDCILDFLKFLGDLATKAGFKGRITMYLPFDPIEELINKNDEARRDLIQAMMALRRRLEHGRTRCPTLGVILSAHTLPFHEFTDQNFVRACVLRIPALSTQELELVLRRFLGHTPTPQELTGFDVHTGGIPCFVDYVLRCTRVTSRLEDSYSLLLAAMRSPNTATPPSQLPGDIWEDIDAYAAEVLEILRAESQGGLGSRPLLRAWHDPDQSQFSPLRLIHQLQAAWLKTGLMVTQGFEGDGLSSLGNYPEYRLRRAGQLPRAFADMVLERARKGGMDS